MSQGLPRGFRLIGNANYFTSINDQQKYEQNLGDLSHRSRSFSVNLSGTIARWYRISVLANQRDYFNGTQDRDPSGTGAADRLLVHRPPARTIAHLRGRQRADWPI